MPTKVRCVLFDFDGTLATVSEPKEAALKTAASLLSQISGVEFQRALKTLQDLQKEMELTQALDRDEWWREAASRLGITLASDTVVAEMTKSYWEAWGLHSRLFPDALSALSRLKMGGLLLGIVANTDGEKGLKRDRMARALPLSLFDVVIVAGDDLPAKKPNPEPFALALSYLGVGPESCLYVGDDPLVDVPGARAAGLTTALISASATGRPDLLLGKLRQLPLLLSKSLLVDDRH